MTIHTLVIARRERKRPTRQSIVSRKTQKGNSLRSLAHSGSPRAFSPRDDNTLLSLRGGSASDRRGNPSCLVRRKRGILFALWLTVDRHGLSPRDERVVLEGPALTRLALINPVPHRHANKLRKPPYRHFLRFRRILCLQVNRGSGTR